MTCGPLELFTNRGVPPIYHVLPNEDRMFRSLEGRQCAVPSGHRGTINPSAPIVGQLRRSSCPPKPWTQHSRSTCRTSFALSPTSFSRRSVLTRYAPVPPGTNVAIDGTHRAVVQYCSRNSRITSIELSHLNTVTLLQPTRHITILYLLRAVRLP